MRYRLRTLMIALGLGPPVIAGVWWGVAWTVAWLVSRPGPHLFVLVSAVAVLYLAAAAVAVAMKELRGAKRFDWLMIAAGIGAALAGLGVIALLK